MARLAARLRSQNIERSIGVPQWFDSGAIAEFLRGRPTVTRADRSCAVGYQLSPDGGAATAFVLVEDGDEYPSWIADGIDKAARDAGQRGAIRFDAWVPEWNLRLMEHIESLNFIHEGELKNIIHAWNRRWSVHIYACELSNS
ncbi:hypothetical protein [Auritidibacter ignavus]|uniref:hypothetical protein n=1 Tax=Auritidibacter ignavus TaxID=678932 RepID=UPI00109D183E|nr:hypothetical protein [Auritidibacter ignavus]